MISSVGWDDDPVVRDWVGPPPLAGDRTADACVVGLGASGLAAVEALAGRGLDVVGLDAGRVGAGAAGRNGGFLLGGSALFLHDALDRWGPPALDLYRATLTELDQLCDRLGPRIVRRVGSIRLAGLPGEEPPADELADCSAHADALCAHDLAVEDYDGALGRGIYLPDDAATNPAARVVAVAASLSRRASLHEHTLVRSVSAGRVATDHGSVRAPVIVVAIDGRLDQLLPQLSGYVRTARLQMLATEAVTNRLACPVYARWGYDYAQQLPTGELFVGAGRDRFVDAEWTASADSTEPVQGYIRSVAERFADREVNVTHRWAASVGYTPDSRPLCTLVDNGVVAVGGYSGTGNLVGPVAARAAVELAVDGVAPPPYLAQIVNHVPRLNVESGASPSLL